MTRWIVAIAVAWLGFGCSNAPSKSDCEKLLDKTVTLELTAAGASTEDPAFAQQKAKLIETAGEEFVEQCVDDLPRSRVACALKAQSKPDLLACDEDG